MSLLLFLSLVCRWIVAVVAAKNDRSNIFTDGRVRGGSWSESEELSADEKKK